MIALLLRAIIITSALTLIISSWAYCTTSATYEKDESINPKIHEIIELSGVVEKSKGVTAPIINQFKQTISESNKDIDHEIIKDILDEHEKVFTHLVLSKSGVVNLNALIFQRNLDSSDIESFLGFYKSELWAKYRADKNSLTKVEFDKLVAMQKQVFSNVAISKKQLAIQQEFNTLIVKYINEMLPITEKYMKEYIADLGYILEEFTLVKINTPLANQEMKADEK